MANLFSVDGSIVSKKIFERVDGGSSQVYFRGAFLYNNYIYFYTYDRLVKIDKNGNVAWYLGLDGNPATGGIRICYPSGGNIVCEYGYSNPPYCMANIISQSGAPLSTTSCSKITCNLEPNSGTPSLKVKCSTDSLPKQSQIIKTNNGINFKLYYTGGSGSGYDQNFQLTYFYKVLRLSKYGLTKTYWDISLGTVIWGDTEYSVEGNPYIAKHPNPDPVILFDDNYVYVLGSAAPENFGGTVVGSGFSAGVFFVKISNEQKKPETLGIKIISPENGTIFNTHTIPVLVNITGSPFYSKVSICDSNENLIDSDTTTSKGLVQLYLNIFTDGNYLIEAEAISKSLPSSKDSVGVKADTSFNYLTIINPKPGDIIKQHQISVEVNVNCPNLKISRFYLLDDNNNLISNLSSTQTGNFYFDFNVSKDGDYKIYGESIDVNNKVDAKLVPFTVNTPPEIVVNNYQFLGGLVNGTILLNLTIIDSDINMTYVDVYNDANQLLASKIIPTSGNHVIYFNVPIDDYNIKIDAYDYLKQHTHKELNLSGSSEPLVINSPSNNSYISNHTILINLSVNDPNITCTNITIYDLFGNVINSTTTTQHGTFVVVLGVPADGVYLINVVSCYLNGEIDNKTINITVDTVPPTITLLSPIDNANILNSKKISFEYLPEDTNLDNCELYLYDNKIAVKSSVSGVKNEISYYLDNGHYEWHVICYDLAGNKGTSQTNAFNVSVKGTTNCGDGICSGAENSENCYIDCGSVCGDGVCNGNETCSNCVKDCNPCSEAHCGDGICNAGENSENCPKDCYKKSCNVGEQFINDSCIPLGNGQYWFDAPAEAEIYSDVPVVLYNGNNTVPNASFYVVLPDNSERLFMTNENGLAIYQGEKIGDHTYSLGTIPLKNHTITYIYDPSSKPTTRTIKIPIYAKEPSEVKVEVYSLGKRVPAEISIDGPEHLETSTNKNGEYKGALEKPGKYMFTITASNVKSLSAKIDLNKKEISNETLDFWWIILLIVALIIAFLLIKTKLKR